ncbi:DUF423 domain-containing protein [Acinetobacter sp. c3-l95]|uniref:DUF423 domain-containing protein n=1 Tax=Acinetobacter sp. c3-l95 TaxID=3342804 RepID=UPI0035B9C1BC
MRIAIASINLACAIMLGAFGAHGLKNIADEQQLAWWATATQYFFYHALGLLAVAVLYHVIEIIKINLIFNLMQAGIVLFSGSLYLMALGMPKMLGMITPIGGLCFILAWLLLAVQAFKLKL